MCVHPASKKKKVTKIGTTLSNTLWIQICSDGFASGCNQIKNLRFPSNYTTWYKHTTSVFFFYEKLVSMEFGKKQSTQPFYQSLYLYIIPLNSNQRTLCASSMLNLFLRFELHLLHKIIFMEFRPKAWCDQDRDHESRVTDDLKP